MYAIILAAGTASRMKDAKLLLKYEDKTILENMVLTCLDADLIPIVVTGCYKKLMNEEILRIEKKYKTSLIVTHNEDFEKGQLSSLIVGVKKLKIILKKVDERAKDTPYFITVADLPLLKPHHFTDLVPELADHMALRPVVKKTFGHPVLLNPKLNDEIVNLQIDGKKKEGLRSFLARVDTIKYETDDVAYITDIDTKESYRELLDKKKNLV
ncbi:MAG: nucleotidyltransferase family protein [Sphaerochaeta sp.]